MPRRGRALGRVRESKGQCDGVAAPQRDRDDLVGLGTLESDKGGRAAGAECPLHVSLRGHHVRVVHAAVIATQDDEGLIAGESGWPLQLSLNEPRIPWGPKSRGSEGNGENESDCRRLHGGVPQTARAEHLERLGLRTLSPYYHHALRAI